MASHFGGISPVRQQQKIRTLGLIGGIALVVCLAIAGLLLVTPGKNEATQQTKRAAAPQGSAPIEMIEVLIPIQRIEAGQELLPSLFRKDSRPKQGLSARAVRDFEEVKGQYSRSLIAADSPLLLDYVTPIKPSSIMTASIPEGYRAVTIRVNAQSAVEGWARPGARVDVIWAAKIRGERTVSTIVHNAKILSAQSSMNTAVDESGKVGIPSTVTLLVTAKNAQKIQLAKGSGSLSLLLRGDTDVKASDGTPLTTSDLIGDARRDKRGEKVDGIVTIGGQKYKVVQGKMKPVDDDELEGEDE